MGVVTNEIKIAGIEANFAGVMTSVSSMALAVGALEETVGDENSGLVKEVDDLTTSTAVTLTAAENVDIEVSVLYKVGNIVVGQVRFKISSDHTGTSDILLGTISAPPKDNYIRCIAYNWLSTNNKGMININNNGNVSAYSTTIAKNVPYYFNVAYVTQ